MERERALKEVKGHWRDIIGFYAPKAKEKVNGESSYICPFCGHGTHGDGLTRNPQSKDKNGLKCFGCDFSGDIIDLIAKVTGKDFNSALDEAAACINIAVDKSNSYSRVSTSEAFGDKNMNGNKAAVTAPTAKETAVQQEQEEPKVDYTAFFLQARKDNKGEYLESRGISKEIQDKFCVGFVSEWKSPKASSKVPGKPYVIFPTSANTYCARYTGTDEKMDKYKKMHVGRGAPFFCQDMAFKEDGPIFVVEGETDALSIWELDKVAISLGSVSGARRFVELAAEHKDRHYIIALDNDGAGAEAVKTIREGLKNSGVSYSVEDICGQYKDPNERLVTDRQGLSRALKMAALKATDPQEYAREKLAENRVSAKINDFWDDVMHKRQNPPVTTGFVKLNEVLDGGIYPEQLIIMGAISSLGKTTLLLQLADNIAAAGTPVLFFSLEMSRNEIISKSISRHTFYVTMKKNISDNHAKTQRGVCAGHKYFTYSKTDIDVINEASKEYSDSSGKNLYIYEGRGDTGAAEVEQEVREFIRITGQKPVVFIDYLQILAPHDPKMTDKQNTDYAVKALKQLARDEGIAVFAISSLNRDNYFTRISMQAFKESGAIEYSSDVLIGLQFKGTGYSDFDVNAAKREYPRNVELHILKNRNGAMPKPIAYQYYTRFNYFHEGDYIEPPSPEEVNKKGKGKAGESRVQVLQDDGTTRLVKIK